jgi:hypothetical protein
VRPSHLADDHWSAIEVEVGRLLRSLEADDGPQALSDLKCLVESVARIVLDLDGEPADPAAVFDTVVNRAHTLLAKQPGHELADQSPFGQMATQASKIVRGLGTIRNEFGGGHGRARIPTYSDEMVSLALDGSLLWLRWALPRIGFFAEGRPAPLINDLVGRPPSTFRSGDLARRLVAASLPELDPRHQRSIGAAVGQRTMGETFVVRRDGLEPCRDSDDLLTWPRDYRLGLVAGLWFDVDGRITLTPRSLEDALAVLEPVPNCGDELAALVDQVIRLRVPGGLTGDWPADRAAEQAVRHRIGIWPPDLGPALERLADHIKPEPPF